MGVVSGIATLGVNKDPTPKRITHSSVISSNAGDDEHEIEGDYEFENQRLDIRSRRNCSKVMFMFEIEQQLKCSARKRRSHHLS